MLSNATKRKNVAHLGAKLQFLKKYKKSLGLSSLTAYKFFLADWCALKIFGVKVLFGVDLKNKFE